MPRPCIRQTITIYPRWMRSDGLIKPIRCTLSNSVWMEQGNTITRQTGNIVRESTFIQVFYDPNGRQYIAPHLWLLLAENKLDSYWAVDLKQPPIAVPWESDYEFPFATDSENTRNENGWIRDNPGAIRILAADDNMRGTDRVKHILLRGG